MRSQQTDHLERITPRKQIETDLRNAALKFFSPNERIERSNMIGNRRTRLRPGRTEILNEVAVSQRAFRVPELFQKLLRLRPCFENF